MRNPWQEAGSDQRGYRPDIDGLRAIAVLSVILFHIDKRLLPGGFVGVDIFFVISGYLISLHIFRDLERGRFSPLEFYRRRVKRIAPAMLLVVAVTLVVTQLMFRPEDAKACAKSALWSLLSMANVHFWRDLDTSYFAAATSEKPLLHLWSLGVEEQFYIVWPLILMLVYRASSSRAFLLGSTLIAGASFLLGEALFGHDPSFVYYMLPTRAGELLVGAIAAEIVMRRGTQVVAARIVSIVGCLGMILTVGACFLLSEDQVFPGVLAVPPTVGTALLILAGNYGNSWPTRLLKRAPMIWVGLISYSAYLWHWPLLAFFRYAWIEVGPVAGVTIFGLTLLLAWLTYLYVELPARLSKRPAIQVFARQFFVPAGVLACLAIVSTKIDGYGPRWFSETYRADLAAIRGSIRPAYAYDYVCQRQRIRAEDVQDAHCVLGAETDAPPVAILWGDSNAAHYVGMLGVFARQQGFRFRNVEIGACPPIDGDPEEFVNAKRLSDCRASLKIVRPIVDAFPVVLISASWSIYQTTSERFFDVFLATARALADQGKLVVIIGKAPVISTYDPLCWEKELSIPFMDCRPASVPLREDIANANARLAVFAKNTPNVEYFDVNRYLCPDGKCSAFDRNGKRIYYNATHLSLDGSWELGNYILEVDGVPAPIALVSTWQPARKISQGTPN